MTSLPPVRTQSHNANAPMFGGKSHRQLLLTKTKRKFEDNKIQSKFM